MSEKGTWGGAAIFIDAVHFAKSLRETFMAVGKG